MISFPGKKLIWNNTKNGYFIYTTKKTFNKILIIKLFYKMN